MKARFKPWSPEDGEAFELAKEGNVSVKIYRRERAAWKGAKRFVFEVVDYTGGSRRLLGFSDLGKARSEAGRIARQLTSGEATAAQFRNADAAIYGQALEILRPTGVALLPAVSTFAKVCEILGGDVAIEAAKFYRQHRADQITRKPVAEVVVEFIANREARKKSPRYIADLRARLNKFAEAFAVDISTITTPDVQGWLDRMKLAPRTVKNFCGALSTLFAFAESRGYAIKGGNPVAGVDVDDSNGDDGAVEIFTPDEMSRLLTAASPEFLPFLAIGAFAGLRSAEIERLEFKDIDMAGAQIEVKAKKAKTRSRRLVPITPNLAQWLAPYAKRSGKVWTGTTNDLVDVRAATSKAADVKWKDNGLRHSFISYRLADVQDVAKVALEAGNSANVIFSNYRELVKPAAAKAWFALAPEQGENIVSIAKAG